jgi:hypothetical protein
MPSLEYPLDDEIDWVALFERVLTRTIEDSNGCLNYRTRTNQGYGTVGIKRRKILTHRVAYMATHGSIPDGTEVDHKCRNRACCNPDHLEAVTHKVNMERGERVQTHCRRNHELTDDNVVVWSGVRRCKRCAQDKAAKTYQRKKAS